MKKKRFDDTGKPGALKGARRVWRGPIEKGTAKSPRRLATLPQRSMQGKSHLYATLGGKIPLSTLFGYQTASLRKTRGLPKTHIIDALCLATYHTGELIRKPESNVYSIRFRPRQTRKQFHSLP